MSEIFELFQLEQVEGVPAKTAERRVVFEYPPAMVRNMDKVLAPYDTNTAAFMSTMEASFIKSRAVPWAMVAFPVQYPLAGFVVFHRASREEVMFSAYKLPPHFDWKIDGPPPVGIVCFRTAGGLQRLAATDEYFRSAWRTLESRKGYGHWFYISEALTEPALARAKRENANLFNEAMLG